MILDTSVVLAFAFRETTAPWLAAKMAGVHLGDLRMSWVNIAEAGMTYRRQSPNMPDEIKAILDQLNIVRLDLDEPTVRLAIEARGRFPLNFGDCFTYAHAKLRNEPLITLDADFLKTDLAAVIHPSRG